MDPVACLISRFTAKNKRNQHPIGIFYGVGNVTVNDGTFNIIVGVDGVLYSLLLRLLCNPNGVLQDLVVKTWIQVGTPGGIRGMYLLKVKSTATCVEL